MLFADAKLLDFSERLDPMTVKELRQGLRARKFVIPFLAIHVFMIAGCAFEYLYVLRSGVSADTEFGEWASQYGILFWGVAYLMLLFVLPVTRFFDLQQEFSGNNAELLLLSGLSRWRIVRGKWVMSVALSGLIFVSILPYLFLRYFLGGFELTQHLLMALGLALNNAAFTALVIGASAYRAYLGRILLLLSGSGVLLIILVAPLLTALGLLMNGAAWWIAPMIFANLITATLFFCVLGLQLARVKLRTFEDPYDPAPGSQVVILYIFAPLLIGIPALLTAGIAGVLASLFFTWIAMNIDPPPKKGKRAFYAQQ